MRFAFLSGGTPLPNWVETPYEWILTRAAGYQEKGHQVLVFAPPQKEVPEEYALKGVLFYRTSPLKTIKRLNEFSPDVVLLHHVHPSSWWNKVYPLISFPKVFWIYGPEVLPPSEYYYKPGAFTRFFLNFLDYSAKRKLRRFYAKAKGFVFTSHYAKERLGKFFPASHGEVCYNPVFLPNFIPSAKNGMLKGLAIEPFEHRLLIGAGFDLLIQAYAHAKGTSLTLAGNGEAASDLARWISQEKSAIELRLIDFKSVSLESLFQAHDYYVSASRLERPLFQVCKAMAYGLPPLVPAQGAFLEAVIPGETGALFKPENPISIKEGLRQIQENFPKMQKQARQWVEKNCEAKIVLEKELQLLEALSKSFK
jgi:glycosyltransferase involved in cell wall biosynthesis